MKNRLIQLLLIGLVSLNALTVASCGRHEENYKTDNVNIIREQVSQKKKTLNAGVSKELYSTLKNEIFLKKNFEFVKTENVLTEPERQKKELEEKLNSIQAQNKKCFYLEYKSIIEEYSSSRYSEQLNLPDTVYDYYTYSEIAVFQKLLAAETTGGDFNSKCNVASVVWNRLNNEKYPNTIREVIYERNGGVQFSPTADGRINTVNVTEDDVFAIEYTFLFGSTAYDCIAFDNVKGRSWNKNHLEYVFTDSINHSFYR